MDNIKQKLKDLPDLPGVYIMHSESGQILYIGKARNLKKRVSQYFGSPKNKTEKVLIMVSKIADFEYIITHNEIEALVLENNLIKQHQPPYNILLKDDKNYPFIKINTKKLFPKVEVVRKLKDDGSRYFGPYMIGITTKDIIDLIYSAFPLRSCNIDMKKPPKNHRPCLNYHIGRCLAPCCQKITEEEYNKIIDDVILFLNGNDKHVEKILRNKMQKASDNMEYELAQMYKEKLNVLDKLVRKQVTALPKDLDLDIFAITSNGLNTVIAILFVRGGKLLGSDKQIVNELSLDLNECLSNFILQYYDSNTYIASEIVTCMKLEDSEILEEYLTEKRGKKVNVLAPHQGVRKQLVDMALGNANDYLEKSLSIKEREDNLTIGAMIQLQEILHLDKMPIRMECYDISHISGTNKVGSMVVFTNGVANRSHYRKFHIKTVEGNNDFESLKEVLTRRLNRLKDVNNTDESFKTKPDLIVIDGGKGQLSSVMEIVKQLGIKDIPFVSLAERYDDIYIPNCSDPIVLPNNSYAKKLVQRLRDEAHRFAITFHRKERKKAQTKSILNEIKGIGEVKQKRLFEKFKTIENISHASVDELLLVQGMDRPSAENIVEYFNNKKD